VSPNSGKRSERREISVSLTVGAYFDGERHHGDGPYVLRFDGQGVLRAIEAAEPGAALDAPFAMPSRVSGHAHLFLDGGLLDTAQRSDYMKSDAATMLATARQSVAQSRAAGLGLVRDAGDRWGVNHAIRDECRARPGVQVRSAGLALRRPGRYGGFMAREVADDQAIVAAVRELAEQCDDIKILLTGIIDFAKASVPGTPQFDEEALRLIVRTAHDCGRRTFAHCSGLAGLEVAAKGGVDSIEHGFFMTKEVLQRMAGENIAWVPTFSPVRFQRDEPGHVGWPAETVAAISGILASHEEHIVLAHQMGVPIVSGSDAGSHGVVHGKALIDEMTILLKLGIDMESALKSATSRPRLLWQAETNDIVPGARPDMLLLDGSPFADPSSLYRPLRVGLAQEIAA
jgi:imidazolonepropionase-like amidohydrolase